MKVAAGGCAPKTDSSFAPHAKDVETLPLKVGAFCMAGQSSVWYMRGPCIPDPLHPQVFVRLRPAAVAGVNASKADVAIFPTSDVDLVLQPPQNAKR